MLSIRLDKDVRSLSEFRARATAYVVDVCVTGRPLLVTQHGRGVVVVLEVRQFELMRQRLEELEESVARGEPAPENQPASDGVPANVYVGPDGREPPRGTLQGRGYLLRRGAIPRPEDVLPLRGGAVPRDPAPPGSAPSLRDMGPLASAASQRGAATLRDMGAPDDVEADGLGPLDHSGASLTVAP